MECPYCGKEMREGAIPVGRGYLYWRGNRPGDQYEQVPLSGASLFDMAEAAAFYCPDCRKILLDVPEIEPVGEQLANLIRDAFTLEDPDGVGQEERKAHRAEEKRQRELEKKRKKDPWEW